MTDKLSDYSTTPGSNNGAVPDGWPEGMLPSDVNDCAREMMARMREWYEDSVWIDYGHTIVSATSSTVVVSGDQTAVYSAGRAFRADGTDYGYVSSSTYGAPNTTINVTGFSVSGTPSVIEVSAITAGRELPQSMTVQTIKIESALAVTGTTLISGPSIFSGTLSVGTVSSGVTQSVGDNSTRLATTAFVQAAKIVRDFAVYVDSVGVSTTATVFPADGTVPQISEGLEIMSAAYTPASASSTLHIEATCYLAAADGYPTMALFKDSDVNALSLGMGANTSADSPVPVTLEYNVAAGSTSSRTYSIRASGRASTGIAFNRGITTATPFGANMIRSHLKITEYV